MLRIKLTTCFPDWPLARQTPGCARVWNGCRFFIDDPSVDDCDLWAVYGGLPAAETVSCPEGATLLITSEPACVHEFLPAFVTQFDSVITSQTQLRHASRRLTQQAFPWHVGVGRDEHNRINHDYDSLSRIESLSKPRLLSVVCSDKKMVPAHRQRLRFVEMLRDRFGDRIDVFGRGHHPISDKWDAIAPYRYHIALENDRTPHFWTEKLADAYLSLAHPIYFGCPNVTDYFPPDALTAIDIFQPRAAIDVIESLIQRDDYATRFPALQHARRLVLDRYNVFNVLADACHEIAARGGSRRKATLRPEGHGSWFGRAQRRVGNWLRDRAA
jgi:hypothetical protein